MIYCNILDVMWWIKYVTPITEKARTVVRFAIRLKTIGITAFTCNAHLNSRTIFHSLTLRFFVYFILFCVSCKLCHFLLHYLSGHSSSLFLLRFIYSTFLLHTCIILIDMTAVFYLLKKAPHYDIVFYFIYAVIGGIRLFLIKHFQPIKTRIIIYTILYCTKAHSIYNNYDTIKKDKGMKVYDEYMLINCKYFGFTFFDL